jgi:hypothetical protein
MNKRLATLLLSLPGIGLLCCGVPARAQLKALDDVLQGRSLAGQAIKGLAVAYAVRQSGKQLNQFINQVTLRNHVPQHLATKVVPILSVGERGYVGGAQVAGPKALVEEVQVVWQYEQGFQRGEYRIKALVPSASLNPLQLKRVEQVGMAALIDVSLGGGFPGDTRSGSVGAGRVLRAAAIAGAVLLAEKPLNQFINTITFNKDPMTRVVPQASFGETAYIGGSQVTGSSTTVGAVKAVFEYWDSFDKGRYRIRALVPVNGVDPTRIRRVEGVGVVALIDTSIAAQERAEKSRDSGTRSAAGSLVPRVPGVSLPVRIGGDDRREEEDRKTLRLHDRGLHLGWEIGKHKGWDKQRDQDDRDERKEEKQRGRRGRGD